MRQRVSRAAADCGESFRRADNTTDQCVVTKIGGRPPPSDEGVAGEPVAVVLVVVT